MMEVNEPTAEQCSAHEQVYEDRNHVGYAIWYPQMNGYAGKAVALLDKNWHSLPGGSQIGGCFDVVLWHDGEAPFEGDKPLWIHHCSPSQFVAFGETIERLSEQFRTPQSLPALNATFPPFDEDLPDCDQGLLPLKGEPAFVVKPIK